MRTPLSPFGALLASLLLVLAGCGQETPVRTSEGGIGGSGGGGGDVAEGGIGGSGSGTTTGYGSIYINDFRYYQIAEDAIVRLDGELVTPTTINASGQGLPLGMVADFLLDDSADAELTRGTVVEMEANHRVIGPVTGLNPLRVLGQPVRVNDSTLLNGVSPDSLSLGTLIKVAGLDDHTGNLRASRLASATSTAHWQLVGQISDVTDSGFRVGTQNIDMGSVTPLIECAGPLANGQSVLLRATPQDPFTPGDALTGVTLVRCLDEGINLFGREVPETLPATTDGFITDLLLLGPNGPLAVKLGGQTVDLSEVLPVLLGTLANLQVGSRLEVDGVLNTTTGVLQARRVRLRDELALLEIIAPVIALDDGVITVLGQPVVALPQTIGTLYDSVVVGDTVKLIGFVSGDTLYAVNAMQVSPQAVSLRALVTSVSDNGDTLNLAGIPFTKDSADSLVLLDAVGEVVDLLSDTVCFLLPFLCPAPSEPPNLAGTLATLTSSSFDGSTLDGGDLILRVPAE
ncbi:MAG: DUF5666 domain-containing protein [Alcanivoracaceae bacterium]